MYIFLIRAPDLNKRVLKGTVLRLYKKSISVTFLDNGIGQL